MKILIIIFATVLSVTFAKVVETEDETLVCIHNHLRDKNLLDKNLKFDLQQSQDLECEVFIGNLKKEVVKGIIDEFQNKENDDDSELKITQENLNCISETLEATNYFELVVKPTLYGKLKKISKRKKNKLITSANQDAIKKTTAVISTCLNENVGELFDQFITADANNTRTLEKDQNYYCIGKYAIDKGLIDTAEFSVNLNRSHNIEPVFDCTAIIGDFFQSMDEMFQEYVKDLNEKLGKQGEDENRCFKKFVVPDVTDWLAKAGVLSRVQLTTDQYKKLRSEFMTAHRTSVTNAMVCFI